MFDRFEQLLARHDLAQNLSRAQRKAAFVLLCVAGLFFVSAFVSTYLAILAGLALVIAHKVLPKKTAPVIVPDVRHRPAPELVVGFDAFMRPARDLLRRVPQDQRNTTMIALLDVMETFTAFGQYLCIDLDEVHKAAAAGALPRLTKGAADVLVAGATLVLHSLVTNEHGRFMVVQLCLPGGADITFHWSVRMLGGACVYRIDQTQTPGR